MRCRCWALDEGALAWPHLFEKKEKKKAPSQEDGEEEELDDGHQGLGLSCWRWNRWGVRIERGPLSPPIQSYLSDSGTDTKENGIQADKARRRQLSAGVFGETLP